MVLYDIAVPVCFLTYFKWKHRNILMDYVIITGLRKSYSLSQVAPTVQLKGWSISHQLKHLKYFFVLFFLLRLHSLLLLLSDIVFQIHNKQQICLPSAAK